MKTKVVFAEVGLLFLDGPTELEIGEKIEVTFVNDVYWGTFIGVKKDVLYITLGTSGNEIGFFLDLSVTSIRHI